MPPSAYPNTATVGQTYLKYLKHPPDWDEVTFSSKFEDGGVDFNTSAASAPQRWTLEYGGLTEAQAKVLDDHYDSAKGQVLGFTFIEPREFPADGTAGATYTDVHYLSYERDHDKTHWNTQRRKVTLIKRPA